MIPVLTPTPRQPKRSFGDEILGSFDQYNQHQQKQKQEQSLKGMGLNPGVLSLPKEAQAAYFRDKSQEKLFAHKKELQEMSNFSKKEAKGEELAGKYREKIAPFQSGLQTIQRMRQLGKGGNLGRGSSVLGFFSEQGNKDRGEYETLGKNLISLASTIPIRNRQEFETLAEHLYDPSLPDARREGILDAMERIIQQNMSAYTSGVEMPQSQQMPGFINHGQKKERPPLTSFMK
jgi:hypothetical protein